MKIPLVITVNQSGHIVRNQSGYLFTVDTENAILDADSAEDDRIVWTVYADPVIKCPGSGFVVLANSQRFCAFCGRELVDDMMIESHAGRITVIEHNADQQTENYLIDSNAVKSSLLTFRADKHELAALIAMFEELYNANFAESEA